MLGRNTAFPSTETLENFIFRVSTNRVLWDIVNNISYNISALNRLASLLWLFFTIHFTINCWNCQPLLDKDFKWMQEKYIGLISSGLTQESILEYLIYISFRQFSINIIFCNWVFDGDWIVWGYILWQKPGVQKF